MKRLPYLDRYSWAEIKLEEDDASTVSQELDGWITEIDARFEIMDQIDADVFE